MAIGRLQQKHEEVKIIQDISPSTHDLYRKKVTFSVQPQLDIAKGRGNSMKGLCKRKSAKPKFPLWRSSNKVAQIVLPFPLEMKAPTIFWTLGLPLSLIESRDKKNLKPATNWHAQ